MTDAPHVEQFIRLFFAGLGLAVIGGLNLALARSRPGVRVLASAAVAGGVVAGYAAWDSDPTAARRLAAVLGGVLVPAVVFGSRRAAAAAAVLCRPGVRWGLVAAAGFGTVLAGSVNYTLSDERAHDDELADLEVLTARPVLADQTHVRARTDRGYDLTLRRPLAERPRLVLADPEDKVLARLGYKDGVIRREPAADQSNCHGWVFTGGRYWVGGEAVAQILADNGYVVVTDPRPGDLAVYRDKADAVGHTAVVRYVADGMPPIVESKWAWMGVFLHPVDKSAYGTNVTYYRSPRDGHLLAGLGDTAPAAATEAEEN